MRKHIYIYLLFMATAILPALTLWANDNVPPGRQQTPLLIKGATIHPISSKPITNGQMLIIKGRIDTIANNQTKINLPANTAQAVN